MEKIKALETTPTASFSSSTSIHPSSTTHPSSSTQLHSTISSIFPSSYSSSLGHDVGVDRTGVRANDATDKATPLHLPLHPRQVCLREIEHGLEVLLSTVTIALDEDNEMYTDKEGWTDKEGRTGLTVVTAGEVERALRWMGKSGATSAPATGLGSGLNKLPPLSPSLQCRLVRMCETSEAFLALISAQINTTPTPTSTTTTNYHHKIATAVMTAITSYPSLFLKLHRLALLGEILEMTKRLSGWLSLSVVAGSLQGPGLGLAPGPGLGQGSEFGSGKGSEIGLTVRASYAYAESIDELLSSPHRLFHSVHVRLRVDQIMAWSRVFEYALNSQSLDEVSSLLPRPSFPPSLPPSPTTSPLPLPSFPPSLPPPPSLAGNGCRVTTTSSRTVLLA